MSSKLRIKSVSVSISVSMIIAVAALTSIGIAPAAIADSQIRMNGQPIFDLGAPMGTYDANTRAKIVQVDLNNALVGAVERGIFPIPVEITANGAHPAISVAGYEITVVNDQSALAANMTPAALAQVWADKLKAALANQDAVIAYVSKVQAFRKLNMAESDEYTRVAPAGKSTHVTIPSEKTGAYHSSFVGRVGGTTDMLERDSAAPDELVAELPAGFSFPVKLNTAVASDSAQPGDMVEAATTQTLDMDGGVKLPAGTILSGHVVDADRQRALLGTGSAGLQLEFDTLRLANGTAEAISARVVAESPSKPLTGQEQQVTSPSTAFGDEAGANSAGTFMVKGTHLVLHTGELLQVQMSKSAQIAVTSSNGL